MLLLGRGVEKGVVCGDALAAVAVSTGAMAQVTISGNLNINAMSNNKVTTDNRAAADTDVKTGNTGNNGGWTASELRFSGSEDLGGGLTASFAVATDLRNAEGFGPSRDVFIGLNGGFGAVRIGNFVPAAAAGFHGYTGARTTSQAGSLYGGVLMAGADGVGTMVGGSFERNTAAIQYTSPNFNGFTVNANYAKNGNDASGAVGDNKISQTGLSFAYAAGPLAVGVGTNQRKVNTENVAAGAPSNITAVSSSTVIGELAGTAEVPNSSVKAKLNWIGASYDLGVAKVMATRVSRTGDTTDAAGATTRGTDLRLNAIGVQVPMGAITLAANTYSGKNNQGPGATDDFKLKGHQLSVTYSLSKRTTVYAAMGENKTSRSGTNDGAAAKRTSNAIGLMHTF